MNKPLFQNKIYVKKSKTHGYGVFAAKRMKKGEMIEQCYVIISNGGDKKLEDYYFAADRKYALCFGFGCIYNHSDDPNVDYVISAKRKIAKFKANRNIKKGEELLVSYGDKWFSSRGIKPKG